MKILVTGGSGFIGSHLCRKLLKQGNRVICLDNNYTGSFKNVIDLLDSDKFRFIETDIQDVEFKENVDLIYNLACPASPIAYQGKHSIETTKTCIIGSLKMLEVAQKNNCRIIQASTSEIYGDPLQHPQKEEYWGNVNPIGIRSCYDEGKRCAESLFFDFYRYENINIGIARIFNTYGPYMNQNDGRVISNFIVQALQNKDITIYGNGNQTRSFCYIEDTVNALIKMGEINITGPINIGNPNEFTILELAKLIINKTNTKSNLIFRPLPSDDPSKRKPDITKAKTLLNWEPKIMLSEGLDLTIDYFKGVI